MCFFHVDFVSREFPKLLKNQSHSFCGLTALANIYVFCLAELVHKSSKDDSRDYLFYLAVANYRLKVSHLSKYNIFKDIVFSFITCSKYSLLCEWSELSSCGVSYPHLTIYKQLYFCYLLMNQLFIPICLTIAYWVISISI
uniref:Uncharacterized protein n=1 Tax=Xiphophorus couchianus TaxID=32473 RepID=A0A3B5M1I7_9TELE